MNENLFPSPEYYRKKIRMLVITSGMLWHDKYDSLISNNHLPAVSAYIGMLAEKGCLDSDRLEWVVGNASYIGDINKFVQIPAKKPAIQYWMFDWLARNLKPMKRLGELNQKLIDANINLGKFTLKLLTGYDGDKLDEVITMIDDKLEGGELKRMDDLLKLLSERTSSCAIKSSL